MRTLSKQEVFFALQYAKSLTESEGAGILNRFRQDQPALCEILFGGFPQAIVRQNQEIAHLFMDLCFDILCVYDRTQGELPKNIADRAWLCKAMENLQVELLALQQFNDASERDAASLQDAVDEANKQPFLLEYLDMAIQECIAGDSAKAEAGAAAANMLFMVTRLFDAIYDETPKIL
ncbi:MAG: hypothetical protein ACU837_06615 [Gammaproteobacteria bacterium]